MKCVICGTNEAYITIERLIDGELKKVQICKSCSVKKERYQIETVFNKENFVTELLTSIEKSNILVNDIIMTKCDKCGMTFAEYKKIRKLGCDQCYLTFSDRLRQSILSTQGTLRHTGVKITSGQNEVD
ncbi:MAG: hypothetical protein GY804_00300, partial [Alphaproteobacteria bacterium]|nr:hypothetical protein [Alphaproteobacteria bacterium]